MYDLVLIYLGFDVYIIDMGLSLERCEALVEYSYQLLDTRSVLSCEVEL